MTTTPGPPDPVNLDGVELGGAVRFGRPVARIVIIHADGREVSIGLPMPGADDGLSKRERLILATVRESDTPLTRKEIAAAMGLTSTTGDFSRAIVKLLDRGLLFTRAGEYTDDESKFAT